MFDDQNFKNFLLSEYIGTSRKDWSQNKVFKNQYNQDVVSYKHPKHEEVFVVDHNKEFEVYSEDDEHARIYRNPSDYVFTIYKDEFSEDMLGVKCISVVIAPVENIEEIEDLSDNQPSRYFPSEWYVHNLNNGCWSFLTGLTETQFIKKMKKIGFCHKESFTKLVEGDFDVSSTSGCKKYLASLYPSTNEKQWKRTTKYKNKDGLDVRGFFNLNIGNVFVLDGEKASVHLEDSPEISKIKIYKDDVKASDFIFSVINSHDDLIKTDREMHIALITPLSHWIKNKYMSDRPNEKPLFFMPSDWEAEDLNEGGTWFIINDLTEEEFISEMKKIGFQRLDDFDEFVDGRS